MVIGNDRLYQSVQAILFCEGDMRSRVVVACHILRKMSAIEIDMSLRKRLDLVLIDASTKCSILDANGNVLNGYDTYTETAKGRRNSTYVKLAKEIYAIYLADLSNKGLD